MKKKNTGLMLSEARGPLNNLFDNLSGEHADYWLDALKKLLRKERLPELPTDDVSFVKGLNSKQKAQKNITKWIEFLNIIPSVFKAVIYNPNHADNGNDDVIDIDVHTNLASFLLNDVDAYQATFCLKMNGSIKYFDDSSPTFDVIFENWKKKSYPDIYTFCKALIELSELYEKAVPVFVK